jgi:hypothetical protein
MIKKIIGKLKTLFYIKMHEKVYNKRVKYIYNNLRSEELIIVFSGFSPKEKPARYNYIKTLSKVNVSKLFLLDNFGFMRRGTYYLSDRGDFSIMDDIKNFIEKLSKSYKIITVLGSSKGGSAALLYGIKIHANRIIVGAPQYFIGDYLDNKKHYKILEGIFEGNLINKNFLNSIIKNNIHNNNSIEPKPEIFIHYSKNDNTYENHISQLIEDLELNNYHINIDVKNYSDHAEVGYYFSKYLSRLITDK